MKKINKILIIRFRQMGDAILTTALCSGKELLITIFWVKSETVSTL